MAVLVYKSLHGLAPQYFVEDCELVAAADRRQLRSSDIATFVIPHRLPTLISAIGHFQLLDHGRGTAFRPTYDSLTQAPSERNLIFSVLCKCFYLLTYLITSHVLLHDRLCVNWMFILQRYGRNGFSDTIWVSDYYLSLNLRILIPLNLFIEINFKLILKSFLGLDLGRGSQVLVNITALL